MKVGIIDSREWRAQRASQPQEHTAQTEDEHFPVSGTHPASQCCCLQPALDKAALSEVRSSEGMLEVSPRALCCPQGLPRPPVPAAAPASSHRLFLTFVVSLGFSNEIPGFKCQLSRGDAIVFSSVPFSCFQNTWQSYYK